MTFDARVVLHRVQRERVATTKCDCEGSQLRPVPKRERERERDLFNCLCERGEFTVSERERHEFAN